MSSRHDNRGLTLRRSIFIVYMMKPDRRTLALALLVLTASLAHAGMRRAALVEPVAPPARVLSPARFTAPPRLAAPPPLAVPQRLPVERIAPARTISATPFGFARSGVVRSAFGRAIFQARPIAQIQRLPYLPVAGTVVAPPPPVVLEREPVEEVPAPAEDTPAPAAEDGLPANPLELASDADLTAVVQSCVDAFPGLAADVVVIDLNGRRRADVSSGDEVYPGSIAKLALLAAAAGQIHRGELPANRLVELPPVAKDRAPALLPAWELVQRAAKPSDHAAANALLDLVGAEAIASSSAALGLEATTLVRGFNRPAGDAPPTRMPAGDAARLMYKIARDDMPAPASAAALRRMLARGEAESGFGVIAAFPSVNVSGFTAEARMKSGEDVSHDVALVTGGAHRYVLVAYTRHESDARPFLSRLALAVHQSLSPQAGYLD
jgi:hypothetical protein